MATKWTGQRTDPDAINGGYQYEGGDDIYTETFNVPINNSIWAATIAQNALDKSGATDAAVAAFESRTNQRILDLANQIINGEGTAIRINGENGEGALKVFYENYSYYYRTASGALKLLPGVRMVSGVYTGTGVYGYGNENRISVPFKPKLVVVTQNSGIASYAAMAVLMQPQQGLVESGVPSGGISFTYIAAAMGVRLFATFTDSGVSWYQRDGAHYQLNTSGTEYAWVAFG